MHVRALTTPQEIETFLRHAIAVHQPDADVEAVLPGQMAALESLPDLAEGGYRAAFVDAEMAGGYRLLDRRMCMGAARLRTGCVGAVYTRAQFRNQGIASAMMVDAIDYTTTNSYALLLLGGIRNFYDKFGYADIHAVTRFVMRMDDLTEFDLDGWSTRPATEDDAELMLDLYARHFGPYAGSFNRSLAAQRHSLRFASPHRQFVLSLDPDGAPLGYVHLEEGSRSRAREVVAETWPAAANLLRHHADFAANAAPPSDKISWVLPPDSPLAVALIRHLSVKEVKNHIHIGGWMARVASVDVLLASLRPRWEQKLAQWHQGWNGTIMLCLEGRYWSLAFGGGELRICPEVASTDGAVHLSRQQFIQLCFAYPAAYVAADDAFAGLSERAQESLSALFAPDPFWIAGTDGF